MAKKEEKKVKNGGSYGGGNGVDLLSKFDALLMVAKLSVFWEFLLRLIVFVFFEQVNSFLRMVEQ